MPRCLRLPRITLLALTAICLPNIASIADGDELGSSMTLEQLQAKNSKRVPEELPPPLKVQSAQEPKPALKIRLYPARWTLKPGSALLHFCRAQMMYLSTPAEWRQKLQSEEWLEGTGKNEIPTLDEIRETLFGLEHVFEEIHDLAMSEDFQWDHRLRDLRGPKVFTYRLPDIQECRSLARLLALKIRVQLEDKDFDGAVSSIRDGLRLAEFVGQGETLIQKLVGIAIAAIMRDKLETAIATPGCPNLYWALATIPRPLVSMGDSVLWELSSPPRVLTALAESEVEDWTEAEAARRWSDMLEKLGSLTDIGIDDSGLQLVLAIASGTQVEDAKKRVAANGYSEERLATIPGLQIVLIDAAQELRRAADEVGKGHLLPVSLGQQVSVREEKEFKNWLKKNRPNSIAAVIAGLLYPAVRQAKEAETRSAMTFNRLLTLEAIRMHAAEHNGKLPDTIEELSPVPAFPDPYSGDQFGYSVELIGDKNIVTLRSAGPQNYVPMQTLRAAFEK